jgi:hypothetical protein
MVLICHSVTRRKLLRANACGFGGLAPADDRLGRDFRLTNVHGSVVKEILA